MGTRANNTIDKAGSDSPTPPSSAGDAGLVYYPEQRGLRRIGQPAKFGQQESIHMIASKGILRQKLYRLNT
ncbi:MAG TPA: hypothetical protein VFU22_29215 [Roseiflexaceae bacterium]|nr:hypothetical protein [Roseiflexaceae bacterium]